MTVEPSAGVPATSSIVVSGSSVSIDQSCVRLRAGVAGVVGRAHRELVLAVSELERLRGLARRHRIAVEGALVRRDVVGACPLERRRAVVRQIGRERRQADRRVGGVDRPGACLRRRVDVAELVLGAHLEGVLLIGEAGQDVRRRAGAPAAAVELALERDGGVASVPVNSNVAPSVGHDRVLGRAARGSSVSGRGRVDVERRGVARRVLVAGLVGRLDGERVRAVGEVGGLEGAVVTRDRHPRSR